MNEIVNLTPTEDRQFMRVSWLGVSAAFATPKCAIPASAMYLENGRLLIVVNNFIAWCG